MIEALGTADERRTTTVYDKENNVLSVTNARNVTTSYAYDTENRQIAMIEAFGTGNARTTTTIYDNIGNVVAAIDPRGMRTTFAYDDLNRQVGMSRGVGTAYVQRTQTQYDDNSNVISTTDALGFHTINVYDEQNRLEAVDAPNTGITVYDYDLVGNRTFVTDPVGNVTEYEYDALQRVTTITDARSGVTIQDYDKNGNLVKLIDPEGNRTTFVYDALNRQTQEIDANNKTLTTVYDDMNMTAHIDRLGRVKEFDYDNLDRLTVETWKDSLSVVVNALTYSYDANNNQLTATDADGAVTMTYDNLDRLETRKDMFGITLTNTYDANNNRTRMVDSKGGTTTSVYDILNRLTSRQFNDGTTPLREDFSYTKRDETETQKRYSDLAGTTLVGSTSFAYDSMGQVTSIEHRNGAGSMLVSYVYEYDVANRVTTMTLSGVTTTYGYNETNQLTNEDSTAYSYDLSGNRTMSGYSTSTGNRMTNDGVFTYTYDFEGNMIKKSKGTLAETWTFEYDHDNHMVGAEKRATDGGLLQMKATYVYDALRNRIEKQVFDTSTTTTRFTYDVGANLILDLDGTNAVVTRYLHGDGTDEWLARISSTTSDWYLVDRQGTVRDIQDNGTSLLIANIGYNAYGEITLETAPLLSGNIRYTGREFDVETQLQFNRARFYDPSTGRWTSEDPIRWGASDFNIYRYVTNAPTNKADPLGLDSFVATRPTFVDKDTGPYIRASFENFTVQAEINSAATDLAKLYNLSRMAWNDVAEVRNKLDHNESLNVKERKTFAQLNRWFAPTGKQLDYHDVLAVLTVIKQVNQLIEGGLTVYRGTNNKDYATGNKWTGSITLHNSFYPTPALPRWFRLGILYHELTHSSWAMTNDYGYSVAQTIPGNYVKKGVPVTLTKSQLLDNADTYEGFMEETYFVRLAP